MKQLISGFALLLAATVASAQPGQGPGAKMLEDLDLTDAQREQIIDIRAQGGGGKEIRAVLTEEQRAQLKAQHGERKAQRGPKIEHLKAQLGLSEEQAQQMRDIVEQGGSREEIRAVMTPEQQTQFDALRERHRAAR
ncbi:MAG: hypothetical protein KDI09_16670 [Halioglobus sp.]|nr:hypothetical protein [Halioglobus sp.]